MDCYRGSLGGVEGGRPSRGLPVSSPDADHIGGFLHVFDAFEVGVVYVSGDPKGTLSYNLLLRGEREEGSEVEVRCAPLWTASSGSVRLL